jgi:hypothetical protein
MTGAETQVRPARPPRPRDTLVKVLIVQAVALALLGLLQWIYTP